MKPRNEGKNPVFSGKFEKVEETGCLSPVSLPSVSRNAGGIPFHAFPPALPAFVHENASVGFLSVNEGERKCERIFLRLKNRAFYSDTRIIFLETSKTRCKPKKSIF